MGTYGVPELSTPGNAVDFSTDFEDMLIDYLYTEWTITDPAKDAAGKVGTDGTKLQFRPGFPNYSKPFELLGLQGKTTVLERLSNVQWYMQTIVNVTLISTNISRDQISTQLGNMERELQRIARQYKDNEIPGIKRLYYLDSDRKYLPTDDYTKSTWEAITQIAMCYVKINIEV